VPSGTNESGERFGGHGGPQRKRLVDRLLRYSAEMKFEAKYESELIGALLTGEIYSFIKLRIGGVRVAITYSAPGHGTSTEHPDSCEQCGEPTRFFLHVMVDRRKYPDGPTAAQMKFACSSECAAVLFPRNPSRRG